jgi:4-hydroxybenzoyl-CoA thioesterase/acyl-CoA thioester hydrolase
MAHEYHTTRRIEWADTDTAGIIHFARYFCFMEEVEHEFLRSLGLSVIMDCDGQRVTWPRVRATCEFLKPVKFEDVVDVHLRVQRKGGKSLTYTFSFRKTGDEVARGEIVAACCRLDGHGLKAIPIPDSIAAKIQEGPKT